MKFVDYPRPIKRKAYDIAIHRAVERLQELPGIVSVFQIGSVSAPGISDIDLLVVVDDDAEIHIDLLDELSRDERYLFVHSPFGVRRTDFARAQQYSFFHNYRYLAGEELSAHSAALSADEVRQLKTQMALEYLIRAFIGLTVERTYRIVRVRGLLLHVKALAYDLEFLNIDSGPLFDLVSQLVAWRSHWFDHHPGRRILAGFFKNTLAELRALLDQLLQRHPFFLPSPHPCRLGRNMTLQHSDRVASGHRGFPLPNLLAGLGRKYFNVQHRFNDFTFFLPITNNEIPDVQSKAFQFAREMKAHNARYLPRFLPLTSSLNY